jgi:prophage tail gpP-like protein
MGVAMSADTTMRLTLKVGGKVYAGWRSVSVRQGLEQIAGTFDLSITERWPAQPTEWSIPPGELCEIYIGDDPVIGGYVDAVAVNYDANSHEIRVTGRDRTGDLVDCSAPTTAFSGLTFAQIAEKLIAPYGIDLFDETVGGKKLSMKQKKQGKKGAAVKKARIGSHLPKQATQCGESVFKTLEKIARSEGVLLVSDGEGGLLITRAGMGGDCSTVLKFGANILRANFEHSHANLYSEISVKGQASAAGFGKFDVTHSAPLGVVKRAKVSVVGNSQIQRHRPLILMAETQADAKRCQQRAEWEAANREAKARKITLTVQGWRQADGDLWRINQRVHVTCPWMRVDEAWLVASVAFQLDESGSLTELTLVGQKAFDLLPEIPAAQGGAGKFNVAGKK